MKKRELYWRIFSQTLVLKSEIVSDEIIKEGIPTTSLDLIETAGKCNLLFNISAKDMIDKVLTCPYIRGGTRCLWGKPSSLTYDCLADYMSVNVLNNPKFQKKVDLHIFKKIEEIYYSYQRFKRFNEDLQVLKNEIITESIKRNSNWDSNITPKEQLNTNLTKLGLQALTDVLINEGLAPIREILNIKTPVLSVEDVNKTEKQLPPTSDIAYSFLL